MASSMLRLVFPQWQGSGKRKYVYYGAKLICEKMLAGSSYEEVSVSLEDDIRLENGILGYRQIHDQLTCACDILQRTNPDKIFLIGGDCGTEVAPVSYLNKLYGGDMAVLWLDAHGDLNTPSSSPSHNFHGMPLRCLLGEGEPSLSGLCFSKLEPAQVFMGGVRELDPPEADYVQKNHIASFSIDDIQDNIGCISRAVRSKGYHNLYVHIDLDVLDSEKCPWALCKEPDGMDTGSLMALLRDLTSRLNVVGVSVVELRPEEHMDLRPLMELVNACKDIYKRY